MSPDPVHLTLLITSSANTDPNQLDHLTQQLRDEIRDVEVELTPPRLLDHFVS